ncbi:MAG: hypothetical protein MR009_05745 [Sutterellaceae bacterium]|nr:hypothetical protein [Sutterellaceae bacterium]MDD7442749.1 hypothetical protein [Sutterellaceae bacterium]
MAVPSYLEPAATAVRATEAEWDEKASTLILTTPLCYPGTEERVMVFISPDAETGGWQVDDGGGAVTFLRELGADLAGPACTACLRNAYEEKVLMLDEAGNYGIPVLDAEDLATAALEVETGSLMLYAVGRFSKAASE